MHTTRREILLVCAAALLALAGIGVRTAEAAAVGPGSVLAFGANASGQLGRAATTTPNLTPTLVGLPGAIGSVTRVAAGAQYSLALTASGQLYTFGVNTRGQRTTQGIGISRDAIHAVAGAASKETVGGTCR